MVQLVIALVEAVRKSENCNPVGHMTQGTGFCRLADTSHAGSKRGSSLLISFPEVIASRKKKTQSLRNHQTLGSGPRRLFDGSSLRLGIGWFEEAAEAWLGKGKELFGMGSVKAANASSSLIQNPAARFLSRCIFFRTITRITFCLVARNSL